ncbi:MAG: hypothetical protein ACTSQX_10255 [Candidatus Heimdallarchaeota archaeon]
MSMAFGDQPFNDVLMIVGIVIIFGIVIAVILWDQIRNARKLSKNLDKSAHGSPSSFDAESKTKMMTRIDKRESKIRRERVLEGGTLPELTELAVYTPTLNEKISTPEVDVRGKTAIKSIVWINNQASFVDVDGSFIGTIKLHKGKNILEIVSIGPHGKAMRTKLAINCTAKEAVSPQSADYDYLLPAQSLDFHPSDATDDAYTTVERTSAEVSLDDQIPVQPGDRIIVPESEIDPTVLAALRGDPLSEEPVIPEDSVSLDDIGDAFPDGAIPGIPDVGGPEEEDADQIPEIPDVVPEVEDEVEEPIHEETDEEIDEAVKAIEEVVKIDEEFEPDKIMPFDEGKDTIELDEFQPLHQQEEGTQDLVIDSSEQTLKDERSTVILHHNGLVKRKDGETVPILKIEKRIENVEGKWFTTIGLANVSDVELKDINISEFISNTFKLKDKLPINVEEPVIETLSEGNKITWKLHSVKPQMKVFITYTEDVNPIDVTTDEQRTPKITVRK